VRRMLVMPRAPASRGRMQGRSGNGRGFSSARSSDGAVPPGTRRRPGEIRTRISRRLIEAAGHNVAGGGAQGRSRPEEPLAEAEEVRDRPDADVATPPRSWRARHAPKRLISFRAWFRRRGLSGCENRKSANFLMRTLAGGLLPRSRRMAPSRTKALLLQLFTVVILARRAEALPNVTQVIDGVPQVVAPQQLIVSCNTGVLPDLCTAALDTVGAVVVAVGQSAFNLAILPTASRCRTRWTPCASHRSSHPPIRIASSSAARRTRRPGIFRPSKRRGTRPCCPPAPARSWPCSTRASPTRTGWTTPASTGAPPCSTARASRLDGTS